MGFCNNFTYLDLGFYFRTFNYFLYAFCFFFNFSFHGVVFLGLGFFSQRCHSFFFSLVFFTSMADDDGGNDEGLKK